MADGLLWFAEHARLFVPAVEPWTLPCIVLLSDTRQSSTWWTIFYIRVEVCTGCEYYRSTHLRLLCHWCWAECFEQLVSQCVTLTAGVKELLSLSRWDERTQRTHRSVCSHMLCRLLVLVHPLTPSASTKNSKKRQLRLQGSRCLVIWL